MRLSIQQMQLTAATVIATSCLLLASLIIFPSVSNYLKYRSSTEEFARYDTALKALWSISAERGPSNTIMGRTDDAEALTKALVQARHETDENLEKLRRVLAADIEKTPALTEAFKDVKAKIAYARGMVDRVASLPEKDRTGFTLSVAIRAMFDAADGGQRLRDAVGQTVVKNAPVIGLDIVIVGAAGTMRDRIGRLGSYVVISIGTDELTRAKYRATFENELQRVMSIRTLLKTYSASYMQSPDVEQAIADVERMYFDTALPYAQAVINQRPGEHSTDAEEFSQRYVDGMTSTSTLRDLLVQSVHNKTLSEKSQAVMTAIMSVALTLIAITAMAILVFIYRKTLLLPMLSARRQIVAIAHGDLTDTQHTPDMAREMEQMFHGLEFLKEQLRSKQTLEREREEMAEQLWKLSRTDPLTGTFNRRALEEVAGYIFTETRTASKGIGVVIVDVDHFKSINDRYGHTVGDSVLKTIADVLSKNLRDTDILARYGGEEFVILLQDVTQTMSTQSAERLRYEIEAASMDEADDLSVTASFGVAWRDANSTLSWKDLMVIADERLYEAKRAGRNRVSAGTLQTAC